jgi:rSAM/selenodomain-associated transferase 2
MDSLRLSIVLPALDEAALIVPALERLARLAPDAERIVADGGSTDGTPDLARPWARVIAAPRGRARQMNAGAAATTGDWLLFLHVDTELPEGFAAQIARAAQAGFRAGAFRLRIAGRHPWLPLVAWGATLRTRWRGIAFGDQGLFVRADVFRARGGFPDLPLMEDFAWTRNLRRAGIALYVSPLAVTTSGRRWDGGGFWRTWWGMRRNQWYFARSGEAESLARRYGDAR